MTIDQAFLSQLSASVSDPRVVFRAECGDFVVDIGAVDTDGQTVFVYLLEAGK